jgi:hypothetical protein
MDFNVRDIGVPAICVYHEVVVRVTFHTNCLALTVFVLPALTLLSTTHQCVAHVTDESKVLFDREPSVRFHAIHAIHVMRRASTTSNSVACAPHVHTVEINWSGSNT